MVREEDSSYFAIRIMAVDLSAERIVGRIRQQRKDTHDERRLFPRLQVRYDQEKHANTVRLFTNPVTAENKG
jgi:hypothetical protein